MGGIEAVIAIGVGCRKDCPAEEIVALVREALAALPPGAEPRGVFSIATKRDERGLLEAAARLELPIAFLGPEELRDAAAGASLTSARIVALHGLPSVAETAALAGAGRGATLLVPRRASARATCAIAGPAA